MCFDTQENVLKKNSPAVENRKGQSKCIKKEFPCSGKP